MSQREKAIEILDELRDAHGVDDKAIAEYLFYHYLSGDDALDALQVFASENDIPLKSDEEEEEEESDDEEEKEEAQEEEHAPNAYLELKRKHEKEYNDFPMVFAFDEKQFKEAMEKLGLTEKDTDKILSIGGGGYIRKTDAQALSEMVARHKKEKQDAINADETGRGFIFDMFDYELANHEYNITYEVGYTLDALGFTYEQVMADERLKHGLELAKKANSSSD